MKNNLLYAATFMGLLLLSAFHYKQKTVNSKLKLISRQEIFKNKFNVQCSPDWNYLNTNSLAKGIIILKGWGNYQWNITSKSDSARLYFQQGINMVYCFHIIELMASFKKAEQFDKGSAMIYWA